MRAPCTIAAFLLVVVGIGRAADAHVPLWAPRVSLSLALDWNKLAVAAIHRPKPAPAPRAQRHKVPKLTVTAAAPAPAQREIAAYQRTEGWMRDVLIPHYVNPDVDHRQKFRQFYIAPYTPYLGAYGAVLSIETDTILR